MESKVAKLESENAMLHTENSLYESKVREIQQDQSKMYLIMFRKGQQAANEDVKEVRKFNILQLVDGKGKIHAPREF